MKSTSTEGQFLVQNTTASFTRISLVDFISLTDIAKNIIPKTISRVRAGLIYASEDEVLKMALFDISVNQWREQNKTTKQGNMSDHQSAEQLIILSNMESINPELTRQSISQSERLLNLNNNAIHQMS
jgi:hypothetical protein